MKASNPIATTVPNESRASIRPLERHNLRIKMKSLLLVAISATVLFACKKSSVDSNSSTMSNSDLQTQSDDQARVSTESDAAFDDVNTVMNDQASVTGSSAAPTMRYGVAVQGGPDTLKKSIICDAIVTIDTTSDPRVLTIIYNGGGCGFNRKRTGTVTVSIPAGKRWRDAGTQVTVTFNLTITRVSDGKSIKLTGSHVYTDVTGGNIFALSANTQAPSSIRSPAAIWLLHSTMEHSVPGMLPVHALILIAAAWSFH